MALEPFTKTSRCCLIGRTIASIGRRFKKHRLRYIKYSDCVDFENDLKYIIRVEKDSNRYHGGKDGAHVGAHIVKKVGVSGSLWGDNGWDTETNESLWPWPNQAQIRDWFRATANPPSGASPSSNNRAGCIGLAY